MRQTSRPQTNPRRRPSYNHTDDNYNHSYATQPAWLTATVTATLHSYSHSVGNYNHSHATQPIWHSIDNYNHSCATQSTWLTATATATLHSYSETTMRQRSVSYSDDRQHNISPAYGKPGMSRQ